jgi:hypothetical protein
VGKRSKGVRTIWALRAEPSGLAAVVVLGFYWRPCAGSVHQQHQPTHERRGKSSSPINRPQQAHGVIIISSSSSSSSCSRSSSTAGGAVKQPRLRISSRCIIFGYASKQLQCSQDAPASYCSHQLPNMRSLQTRANTHSMFQQYKALHLPPFTTCYKGTSWYAHHV